MAFYEDNNNVKYTLDKSTLYLVPSGTKHVSILSQPKYVRGESTTSYAFYDCRNSIMSFSFSSDSLLEEVRDYAFLDCALLTDVDLTQCKHLKYIGAQSFKGCYSVTSIKLPSSVSTLGESVFMNTSISQIDLPTSLTIIPNSCFKDCSSLMYINFPTQINIVEIGRNIISNTKIRTFNIPASVTNLYPSCFCYSNVESISISSGNSKYKIINSIVLTSDGQQAVCYPTKMTGKVNVPSGVKTLGYCCFKSCSLTQIELPDTLISIIDECFRDSKLIEINIPNSVTSIFSSAFRDCIYLTTVTLSESLKSLPGSCFYNSSITSIVLPLSIVTIGGSCFRNCPNLKKITLPDNLTSFSGSTFPSTAELVFRPESKFYIDSQSLVLDKSNTTIFAYLGPNEPREITVLDSVETIMGGVFSEKDRLSKIIFSSASKLKSIKGSAFYYCSNLVFVNLPTTIEETMTFNKGKTLGSWAFHYAMGLQTFNFESSTIDLLEDNCFYHCIKLTSIRLPSTIKSILANVFYDCIALNNFIITGNSLKSIGSKSFANSGITSLDLSGCTSMTSLTSYALSGTPSLTSVSLPESLTSIEDYCFMGSGIESIAFPASLSSLGVNAFLNCISLTSITIPSGSSLDSSSIGIGAFRGCFNLRSINCDSSYFEVVTGALFTRGLDSLFLFPPASPITFFSLPGNTHNINEGAFLSCTNLVSVFIPSDSISRISTSAFEGCTSLTWINIPICVSNVGSSAFKGCDKLGCGINVENKSDSFLKDLFNIALLPRHSVKPCDSYVCTKKYCFNSYFTSSLISFIAVIIVM